MARDHSHIFAAGVEIDAPNLQLGARIVSTVHAKPTFLALSHALIET
jgi:hypothetical protein